MQLREQMHTRTFGRVSLKVGVLCTKRKNFDWSDASTDRRRLRHFCDMLSISRYHCFPTSICQKECW
ncbi:hypothetical protein M404DRAFT_1007999 [Pisolithus tinctorius Marx 270]|uniref:Uncharacterized protein n=1 Tax=Pisolithus tinctorius Marx 270 TaxID=870435 RepID=A0A0C3ICW4_PISTI|nr:hypothetical protein M404DRAFT_1007999 [Pisolithus tinctorius Marx 270]